MTKQPQSMQQLLAKRQSALYVNDSESPFTPPEADGRKCADRPLLDGEQPAHPLRLRRNSADDINSLKGYVHFPPA